MKNITITEVSHVTTIAGVAKFRTHDGVLHELQVGDVLQPGMEILLGDATNFAFEKGLPDAMQTPELPADQQPAMPAMGAANGDQTTAQITALQQAILSGQDPTQAFEAAAAGIAADAGGAGPGSGNDGFISITRIGDATIAESGYDTTAPIADQLLTITDPAAPVIDVTNTPAVVTTGTGVVQEDIILSTGGLLTVTDPDIGDAFFIAQNDIAGSHGSFSINTNGQWSYNLNNNDADVQALAAGESLPNEVFTVTTIDGTTTTITISITGTNDTPTITVEGTDALGAVTEDAANPTLSDSGTITFNDIDLIDAHTTTVVAAAGNTLGGNLVMGSVSESGTTEPGTVGWTYSVANSATQYLAEGQTVTESFTVTIDDGQGGTVDQVVTVTITGTNDAPVLDLDYNNSTAAGYNYVTSYTANTAAVAIADSDTSITDIDSTMLKGATITLTNAQIGDLLSVGGIPGSLGIAASVSGNVVTLTGDATLDAYEQAIHAITFSTTNNTVTDDRIINVVVTDDFNASSNVATSTISVMVPPITYDNIDTGWLMNYSTQSHSFDLKLKGGNATIAAGGVIYWDILVKDTNLDASLKFDISKLPSSVKPTYEQIYASDGSMIFRVYLTATAQTILNPTTQFGVDVLNASGSAMVLNSDEYVRPHSNYTVDYSDPAVFDTGTVTTGIDKDWLSTYVNDPKPNDNNVNGGEFSKGVLTLEDGITQHYNSGSDIVYGTTGHDQLYGEGGNDFIAGRAGNDILDGGDGNDTLVGGYGNDMLYGGNGNDILVAGLNSDILDGGSGNDTVSYNDATTGVTVDLSAGTAIHGSNTDTLTNIENIIGSQFNDNLTGDNGVNNISGGAGNDTLIGGLGNDILTGGTGADIFKWTAQDINTASGAPFSDTITDFSRTDGDKLDLSDVLSGDTPSNLSHYLTFSTTGSNVVVSVHADGNSGGTADMTIVLEGQAGDLSALQNYLLTQNGVIH